MFEIDSPFTMVVSIVAVVTIAGVIKTYLETRANSETGAETNAEMAEMRAEIGQLKDRVRVLEKIVTDRDKVLADEISRLA
ncbi:MAG: hypothetical protein AAF253_01225 [Pseudomonadota bacterium]